MGGTGDVAVAVSLESGCAFSGLLADRLDALVPECAFDPALMELLSALARSDEFASAA
jgi:hypothetical protein